MSTENTYIEFYQGLEENLPQARSSDAFYVTTDSGKLWLGDRRIGVPVEDGLSRNSIQQEGNIAGLKGFYWSSIKDSSYRGGIYVDRWEVTLSTVLRSNEGKGEILFGTEQSFKISDYWSVGDIVSIHIDTKYVDYTSILEIDDATNTLIFPVIPFMPPLKYEYDVTDNAIYVLSKPDKGLVDLGMNAIALGERNKAINYDTFVAGQNNATKGQYSAAFGKNNEVGYCSLASGRNNIISSDHTFSAGAYNTSEKDANASLLFGAHNNNHFAGKRSIVGGENNHNYNVDSAVFGTGNTNRGEDAIVSGNGNTNEGSVAIVSGTGTTNTGTAAIVVGTGTTYNDKNTSIVVGENVRNTGWHSAVFGGNNTNEGASYSLVAGTQNINKGGRSLVVGESNENNGAYALVTGFDNTNRANKAIVNGQGCTSNGENSILSGNNCQCHTAGTIVVGQTNNSISGSNSAIFGGYNMNDGANNSLIAGANHFAYHSCAFMAGEGHWTTRTHQTLLGSYSAPSSDALFAIGCGSGEDNRNNILEVTPTRFSIKQNHNGDYGDYQDYLVMGFDHVTFNMPDSVPIAFYGGAGRNTLSGLMGIDLGYGETDYHIFTDFGDSNLHINGASFSNENINNLAKFSDKLNFDGDIAAVSIGNLNTNTFYIGTTLLTEEKLAKIIKFIDSIEEVTE